jgi:hypothetical protein
MELQTKFRVQFKRRRHNIKLILIKLVITVHRAARLSTVGAPRSIPQIVLYARLATAGVLVIRCYLDRFPTVSP